MLEDRIFSPSAPISSASGSAWPANIDKREAAPLSREARESQGSHTEQEIPEGETQIPIPLSHTANANHVLDWPVVRRLLSRTELALPHTASIGDGQPTFATDKFFLTELNDEDAVSPPANWRLFGERPTEGSIDECRSLIFSYFEDVNVFYPLLSLREVMQTLDAISFDDVSPLGSEAATTTADYCLLLVVLCLGAFARSGRGCIRLPSETGATQEAPIHTIEEALWPKAQLLLGSLSAAPSLKAAQCSMLAR